MAYTIKYIVVTALMAGAVFWISNIGIFLFFFSDIPLFKPTKLEATNLVPSFRNRIKVVTYNVQRRPIFEKQRVPALLQILKDSNADMIALQEVKAWFVNYLMRQPWVRVQYLTSTYSKVKTPQGQLFLLSKFPIVKTEKIPLMSDTYRSFLKITLKISQKSLVVGIVHLDHRLETGRMRAHQLDYIFKKLDSADDVILLGDFNFGDNAEPETSHIPSSYVDIWRKIHPNAHGYTWNNEINDMSFQKKLPNEPSRRLDRIFIKSKTWHPLRIKILGYEPVSKRQSHIFPSDHFGLFAEIQTY